MKRPCGLSSVDFQGGGISSPNGTTHLTLNAVTVRNNVINFAPSTASGAGVLSGGPLTVTNSFITSNRSSAGTSGFSGGVAQGGGIFASGATLYISNTQVLSNSLQGGNGQADSLGGGGSTFGGGIAYSRGSTGSMSILNSIIACNIITGGVAGGRSGSNGGAANGAGVWSNDTGGFAVNVTIDRTAITNNSGQGGSAGVSNTPADGGATGGTVQGGGIWTNSFTVLSLTSSIIARNIITGTAGGDGGPPSPSGTLGGPGGTANGGGLYLNASSTISATAIISNSATASKGGNGPDANALGSGGPGGIGGNATGGGIHGSTGVLTVVNSTVAQNRAVAGNGGTGGNAISGNGDGGDGGAGGLASGGGIRTSTGTSVITSTTIASNSLTAGTGGTAGTKVGSGTNGTPGTNGTASGGGVNQAGTTTVIATILAQNTATTGPDYNGVVSSTGGNIIANATGAVGFSVVNDKLNTDPLIISPVADNGGSTFTAALQTISPAIGFAGGRACPAMDQRGQLRRVSFCDSGAFAVQPNALTLVGTTLQSAVIGTAFSLPLAVRPLYGSAVLTNALVTFTAPAAGTSATFGGIGQAIVPAAGGIAQVSAVANSVAGGPYPVTAAAGSATPIQFQLSNLKRSTTTAISAAPNPSVAGDTVVVTATVAAVGGTPTGSVTVLADTGETCTIAAPAGTCLLKLFAAGPRTLSASYAGDSDHLISSANTGQTVTPSPVPPIPPAGSKITIPIASAGASTVG